MKNFEALRKDWESFQTGGGGGSGSFNILPVLLHPNAGGRSVASPPNQPEVSLTPRDLLNKLGQASFDSIFTHNNYGEYNPAPFVGFSVQPNRDIDGGSWDTFEEGVHSEGYLGCSVELDYEATPVAFNGYYLGSLFAKTLDSPFM